MHVTQLNADMVPDDTHAESCIQLCTQRRCLVKAGPTVNCCTCCTEKLESRVVRGPSQ